MRLRPLLAAVTALVVASSALASAEAADDLGSQKRASDAAADRLRGDLADTAADLAKAVVANQQAQAALVAARQRESAAEDALASAQRKEAQLTARLAAAQDDQDAAESDVSSAQDQLAAGQRDVDELVRQAYRQGSSGSSLDLFLDSSSPSELADRMALVRGALRSQGGAVRQLQVLRADLAAKQAAVRQKRQIIAGLQEQAAAEVVTLDAAESAASDARSAAQGAAAQAASTEQSLSSRKAQEAQRLAAQEAVSAHLSAQLRALAAKRAAAARAAARRRALETPPGGSSGGGSGGSGGSGGGSDSGSSGGSSGGGSAPVQGAGYFSPPVNGPVTSPFGMRFHPVLHVWKLHDGTDFGAACGTPIHASADGTVIWAQNLTGYGNQLAIDHGVVNGVSLTTSYSHQERFAVSVGQHVSRGQVIGYTGQTGYATGCHVHFMVYVNGKAVDPQSGWL